MKLWVNWLVGWGFWILLVMLVFFLSIIITRKRYRGKLPDHIFEYTYRSEILPRNGFFFDSHSHTIASDGVMTAEQLIKWHIANGFHAFVLTDHNTGKLNEKILSLQNKYPEILILPGFEWTTLRIHLNFIGITDFPYTIPSVPTNSQIQDAINKAHELGAIVQVDHITWTKAEKFHRDNHHPTRKQLIEWGADGFEIFNTFNWYDGKTIHIIESMRSSGELPRSIFLSSGTDIHDPLTEYAAAWTELQFAPEERQNVNFSTVLAALREGRTKIWIDNDYRVTPEAMKMKRSEKTLLMKIFAPLYRFREILVTLPGGKYSVNSTFIWILLFYFPLRILFEAFAKL